MFVVDQEYLDYHDGEYCNFRDLYSAIKIAQSFEPITNNPVAKISLRMRANGVMGGGQMWVSIQTDNSGVPSGVKLGQSDYVNVNSVTDPAWIDFVFSTPTTALTANTKYWIVLEGNQVQSDDHYIAVICNTGNGYDRGEGKGYYTSWFNFYDFNFIEYYLVQPTFKPQILIF